MPSNYKHLIHNFLKIVNGNNKNLKWNFERVDNISTMSQSRSTSLETDEFTLIGVTSLLKSGSLSPQADIECYIKYKQIISNINGDKCKKEDTTYEDAKDFYLQQINQHSLHRLQPLHYAF